MKKIVYLSVLAMLISGCSQAPAPKEGTVLQNDEYVYKVAKNNKIQLLEYIGEYKEMVYIPTEINNLKVSSIAKGCFARKKNASLRRNRAGEEEDTDYSTYYVDSSVDEIEDGAFDEGSSFVTDASENNDNWNDGAMTGSAKDNEGNVYYDTSSEDTITKNGIVYVYSKKLGGYYLARCLTQRKEVVVPSEIDGYKVTDIGRSSFFDNNHIESVTLPETIGMIYYDAFSFCSNLKNVTFNCPNLADIYSHAFNFCESLSVVKLPPNATCLKSYSFSNCGEIDEFYMPACLNSLSATAFYETTIKKLYFGGTQERFENSVLNGKNGDQFENTEIVFESDGMDVVDVNSLEDIIDIENNVQVRAFGVISGFCNYYSNNGFRTLKIVDPETNYSVSCYQHNGLPFSDLEYIGRNIMVTGIKGNFLGQPELAEAEFVLLDDEIVELSPTEIKYNESDFNPYDYLNHYCYIDAYIEEEDNGTIFFNGISSLMAFTRDYKDLPPEATAPGTHVLIKGWVDMHNQAIKLIFDGRTVTLLD